MGRRTIVMLVVIAMALGSFGGPWAGVEVPSEIGRTNTVAPAMEPTLEVEKLLEGVGEHFVENRGQLADPDVRFYAEGDPLSVLVTTEGLTFMLRPDGGDRGTTFTMWFEGTGGSVPTGRFPLDHRSSFIHGKDPGRWVVGARAFSEVIYEGIDNGVDLRLYFADGLLKYDIILEPAMDPSSVRMAYDGIRGLSVDQGTGDLLIQTLAGNLRDSSPVLLQEGRPAIAARYRLEGHGWWVEPLGEVDPALPLVIDPGLEFSTRLGGNGLPSSRAYIDHN